jgi:hypothetical protein
LIADTDGNIFGGFTPVEWESGNRYKRDDSLRSFLFTLKNPHGVPPRKFTLNAEQKQQAIYCHPAYCAGFGRTQSVSVVKANLPNWFVFQGRDKVFSGGIVVKDNCNTNRDSYTSIGTHWRNSAYANDTAFEDFLTGAYNFTVKEIEVFEIAD